VVQPCARVRLAVAPCVRVCVWVEKGVVDRGLPAAMVGCQGVHRGLDGFLLPFTFAPSCGPSASAAAGPAVGLFGAQHSWCCLLRSEARFSPLGGEVLLPFLVATRFSFASSRCRWPLLALGPIRRLGCVSLSVPPGVTAPAVTVADGGGALLFCSSPLLPRFSVHSPRLRLLVLVRLPLPLAIVARRSWESIAIALLAGCLSHRCLVQSCLLALLLLRLVREGELLPLFS
jgi:hypothetical protein